MPWFTPLGKPRFSSLRITLAPGTVARYSGVPSMDPLSTRMSSYGCDVCACTLSMHIRV